MRTTFFLLAMLASVVASAQSHINTEMISATYTGSPAVKFRVWWSSVPTVTGQTHNAKVWVWIDFLKLNADNTTTGNTWTRAEISATPAVSSSPASTAALDASTNKGFWLNGVTGSYSATVTATFTNIPANTKFNWCAYVSDYPPNVTLDEGTYTFKGTTNFIVSSHVQPITTKTIAKANLTVNSSSTFTDATDCPGIGSLYCPYTGSDLYMDATHLCQKRASGAQNWEAYIKDSRDGQIYRITQFSDNTWWFADDLAIADKSVATCDGKRYYVGNDKPSCPSGWTIPTISQMQNRWSAMWCGDITNETDEYGASLTYGCWFGSSWTTCAPNTGCNGCGTRGDYIFSDAANSIIWDASYPCGWNCYLVGAGQNTATGLGGRARCKR
jgi:hypothetical protein